jgi:hypothetical protein
MDWPRIFRPLSVCRTLSFDHRIDYRANFVKYHNTLCNYGKHASKCQSNLGEWGDIWRADSGEWTHPVEPGLAQLLPP